MKKFISFSIMLLAILCMAPSPPSRPPLVVQEIDGSPSINGVDTIQVSNGTLSNVGGAARVTIPPAVTVVDNLTSTSSTSALSAGQGKVLQDSKQADMGITGKTDSTSTTSSTVVASATAVKSAYDLANGKQANLDLVKGTFTDGKYCTYTASGTVLNCTSEGGTPITKAYLSILSGSMIPDTCSGLLQKKATNLQFDYLQFETTTQYANFTWIPPDDWDAGTIKVKAIWAAGEAHTNGDTITFGLAGIALADGDSTSQAITTGRVTWTDTFATGDNTDPLQKVTAASGALTIDGSPTSAKFVHFRLDASSTNNKKVWLIGLKIEYGKTGTNPAAW